MNIEMKSNINIKILDMTPTIEYLSRKLYKIYRTHAREINDHLNQRTCEFNTESRMREKTPNEYMHINTIEGTNGDNLIQSLKQSTKPYPNCDSYSSSDEYQVTQKIEDRKLTDGNSRIQQKGCASLRFHKKKDFDFFRDVRGPFTVKDISQINEDSLKRIFSQENENFGGVIIGVSNRVFLVSLLANVDYETERIRSMSTQWNASSPLPPSISTFDIRMKTTALICVSEKEMNPLSGLPPTDNIKDSDRKYSVYVLDWGSPVLVGVYDDEIPIAPPKTNTMKGRDILGKYPTKNGTICIRTTNKNNKIYKENSSFDDDIDAHPSMKRPPLSYHSEDIMKSFESNFIVSEEEKQNSILNERKQVLLDKLAERIHRKIHWNIYNDEKLGYTMGSLFPMENISQNHHIIQDTPESKESIQLGLGNMRAKKEYLKRTLSGSCSMSFPDDRKFIASKLRINSLRGATELFNAKCLSRKKKSVITSFPYL